MDCVVHGVTKSRTQLSDFHITNIWFVFDKRCLFVCLFNLYCYFWLHWVFVAVFKLSLVAASRGCSLVAVHGLLLVVGSLAAEHRL